MLRELWEKDLTSPLNTAERNIRKYILWESLVFTLLSTIITQMFIYLSNFMYVIPLYSLFSLFVPSALLNVSQLNHLH